MNTNIVFCINYLLPGLVPSSRPPLQVSALDLVRRRDLAGLTSLLADVCPLDDEDQEKGNNKVVIMNIKIFVNLENI